jgi:hypothetical protein
MEQLGPAVAALFPDYVPHIGDEALGDLLAGCWRCPMRCCQPPVRGRLSRWARGVLPAAPTSRHSSPELEPPGMTPAHADDVLDRLTLHHRR